MKIIFCSDHKNGLVYLYQRESLNQSYFTLCYLSVLLQRRGFNDFTKKIIQSLAKKKTIDIFRRFNF